MPEERRVQFTQQSSQKVSLHCCHLSPKALNLNTKMVNSYPIFTFVKEPKVAKIRLRFHSGWGMKWKKS